MKKNKIMLSVVSGLLVAAVAVGGTLAYLSDKSNMVTNTFNVGNGYIDDGEHQGLWLDETEVNFDGTLPKDPSSDDRTEFGQQYPELLPGSEFAKDPTFHLTEGSTDSFVIAKVTYAQEAADVGYIFKDADKKVGFNAKWVKVANADGSVIGPDVSNDGSLNGYYLYLQDGASDVIISGGESTDAIFTYVELDKNLTGEEALAAADSQHAVIQGVAVQSTNNTVENAILEAIDLI